MVEILIMKKVSLVKTKNRTKAAMLKEIPKKESEELQVVFFRQTPQYPKRKEDHKKDA